MADAKTAEAVLSSAAVRGGMGRPRTSEPMTSPLTAEVLRALPGAGPRYVACAPGRLDVMGGLSEYTGALVLNTPLTDHVCAGVELRKDDSVSITILHPFEGNGTAPLVLRSAELRRRSGDATVENYGPCASTLSAEGIVRCIRNSLAELIGDDAIPGAESGLSIVLASTCWGLTDCGLDAAVAASVAVATMTARDHVVDANRLGALLARARSGSPVDGAGIADGWCALTGEPPSLTAVQCDSGTLKPPVRLGDKLAFVGVDCGALRNDAVEKNVRVRTSAFMGRLLIERIIRRDGAMRTPWDGHLSRVGLDDYVARFRDRLPTKLKGGEFLSRFGETGDSLTHIDPSYVYKVRSRTEHHIYEHARSVRLVECLSRAAQGDESGLLQAGEQVYASHWSYGQRCGLGSVESDLLVNLLRKHGAGAGIYGAKVSGRGCGGVVTVLLRKTDRAFEAVQIAMEAYRSRSGRTPTLLRGARAGAMVTGAQRFPKPV